MQNRVLFLMQLPPPVHGAATVNKNIADSKLISNNFKTKILELRFISTLEEMGRFSWKKIALIFPFAIRLFKDLIVFRPHLVYYTIVPKGFAFYRDAFFVSIIKLFGKKIAFHLHIRGIQNAIGNSKLKRTIYRFVFGKQTAVVLANSLAYELNGLNSREILVLPNGIAPHFFDISHRNESLPTVLFLSNLFKNKGIFDFIEIIKELKSRGLRFKANIVGSDGDIRSEDLAGLVQEHFISDIVMVSGALYGEQKYTALEDASIFIHPSLDEAFPLTILEAMQAALPVVGSSVGAIPEMIKNGRTGYCCEPGNIADFSDKIALLLEDIALRNEMSKNSRKEYEENYTLDRFEQNLEKIIRHIILQ